jgi:hypothetical protein
MKIDGFTPPDRKVAYEQGVDFVYDLEFGTIKIQSKMMRNNPQFQAAYKGYDDWLKKQDSLSYGKQADDEEVARRLAGILYDGGVIRWSTTIKSGGRAIEPTRENFIDLMSAEPCRDVLAVYLRDALDLHNFRAVSREEEEKNSAAPSSGKSSGEGAEKNSSGT